MKEMPLRIPPDSQDGPQTETPHGLNCQGSTTSSSRRYDHGLDFQTIIKIEEKYSLLGVVHGHWETEEEKSDAGQSAMSNGGGKILNEVMMLVSPIELFEDIIKEDHFCEARANSNKQQIERLKISHPDLIARLMTD